MKATTGTKRKLPSASTFNARVLHRALAEQHAENEKLLALLAVKEPAQSVTTLNETQANNLLSALDDFTVKQENDFEIYTGDVFSIPTTLIRNQSTGTAVLIS